MPLVLKLTLDVKIIFLVERSAFSFELIVKGLGIKKVIGFNFTYSFLSIGVRQITASDNANPALRLFLHFLKYFFSYIS